MLVGPAAGGWYVQINREGGEGVQKYLGRGLMLQTNASSRLNRPLMSDMSGAKMSKSASWCMSWSKLRWLWKNGRKERSDHQVPAVGTSCVLWRVVRCQREGRPQAMTSLKCRTWCRGKAKTEDPMGESVEMLVGRSSGARQIWVYSVGLLESFLQVKTPIISMLL